MEVQINKLSKNPKKIYLKTTIRQRMYKKCKQQPTEEQKKEHQKIMIYKTNSKKS